MALRRVHAQRSGCAFRAITRRPCGTPLRAIAIMAVMAANPAPQCAIVIFGASGDLARRKLIPALYDLAKEKLLNTKSYIVGYSRSPMSNEEFRKSCREAIAKFARIKPIHEEVWKGLEGRLFYEQADYGSKEDQTREAEKLKALDREFENRNSNRLFYLATPPETFDDIIQRLSEHRLVEHCDLTPERWERLIIEKPFGHDLASARALNELLHRSFCEEQIFRIDHYLGKETVQNLMVMRFANSIFEPIWNSNYIDHVQITVAETLGV